MKAYNAQKLDVDYLNWTKVNLNLNYNFDWPTNLQGRVIEDVDALYFEVEADAILFRLKQ